MRSVALPQLLGPAVGIGFHDLNFACVPVVARSRRGVPFTRWVPTGMPRIPPKVLNCVCYLYPSEAHAERGKEFGGTAFLVGVPSRHENLVYIYAVTNWHVAVRDGASVLRINTRDGSGDVVPLGPEDWHFDPRFDIAVAPVKLDYSIHTASILSSADFMVPGEVEKTKIGPGDDVFMIGRFIDHDGLAVNRPAARFGNISVMPAPVKQDTGFMADSYCIDLHSRSGYSGSPVFIYRTPGYDLEKALPSELNRQTELLVAGASLFGLLGIHYAQFPERWEIGEAPPKMDSEGFKVPLVREGAYVKGLSGMTLVLPAWNIADVLNLPRLKAEREAADDAEAERRAREGCPPVSETASS